MSKTLTRQTLERLVEIPAGLDLLQGSLSVPEHARGLVLFVHDGQGSRYSPNDEFMAGVFLEAGLGTLRFDLLTGEEEAANDPTGKFRVHIGVLARRLVAATDWLGKQTLTRKLRLGYVGSGAAAAAALVAAAERPGAIRAIVARDGRPDLAGAAIACVQAPTQLIVTRKDELLVRLNRNAWVELEADKELIVLPGETHALTDRDSLAQFARLATGWFLRFLSSVQIRKHSTKG